MKRLFTNETIDATSDPITTTGTRKLAVHVFGNFDGATVTVPLSTTISIGDAVVLTELSFTAPDMILIDVPDEITIWSVIAGSGAGTDISVNVAGLGE